MLYDSIHHKLLRLPDDVEVWPAHGAGSLCGRNMSKETSSTIGLQRRLNYALQPMTKDEFVALMTRDMVEAPPYFALDAQINRRGAPALRHTPSPRPLDAGEAAHALENGAIVLDVRTAGAYGEVHIPRSLNIGLDGQYATWAGTLLRPDAELVIVAAEGRVDEAAMRLARVGFESARGFLRNGLASWRSAGLRTASVPQISVHALWQMMESDPSLQVIDVRRQGEYRNGHAPGAVNLPLHELGDLARSVDPERPTAVICAGGYRSSIGTSILERLGFGELYNVTGGTSAWMAAGLPAAGAVS